jgi:hypothetical protein
MTFCYVLLAFLSKYGQCFDNLYRILLFRIASFLPNAEIVIRVGISQIINNLVDFQ